LADNIEGSFREALTLATDHFQIGRSTTIARIFITGSADGLGRMAAELLIEQGHSVVLHARSQARAEETKRNVPEAEAVVIGDLGAIAQTRKVAEQVNALGAFDAVIHNAAVGYKEPKRVETEDGLSHVLAVNTIAPYILTAMIAKPKRLVYLSSMLHQNGDPTLEDLTWRARAWDGKQAYSDTKLHDVLLAFGIARRWPGVLSNALEPGWVPTKMGGSEATCDLDEAHRTQVWLAASDQPEALVTGEYFYHLRKKGTLPRSAPRDLRAPQRYRSARVASLIRIFW
jgi:NAD(P)-dependent dehydrogenase (short-subunit alcohol dehydrogenase family)